MVLWSPYTSWCGRDHTRPGAAGSVRCCGPHIRADAVFRRTLWSVLCLWLVFVIFRSKKSADPHSAHPHFTRVARRERPTSTYNITSHSPSSIFCQSSSLTCFKSAVIKRGRANKIPKNNTTDIIIFFIFKINKSKTTQRLPVLPR